MTPFEFQSMEIDVTYYATSVLGGGCVIKKTADTEPFGDVRVRFKGGRYIERHFAFFNLGHVADQEDQF